MTWEALSAIATAFTGIVIAATVVVGARQLRLTRDTLDQLRRATQLEGTMRIMDDLMSPEFREAQRFVINDLPVKLNEPDFLATISRMGAWDPSVHKEITVLRTFERIGSYIKYGLLEGDVIYDVNGPIIGMWEKLQPVVKIHRAERGEGFWENFEYLYNAAERWRFDVHGKEEYLRKRADF